ncbi:hypothetical protein ACFV4I_04815 [Nocardiopsis alba]|uniref:hypothetical protein n=1 Tax=Nocardiopsis alba TaxID=53437 RepID=UPI0033E6175D
MSGTGGRITGRVVAASLLESVSAVATVATLVVIVEVCRRLLAGPVDRDLVMELAGAAAAVVLAGAIVQFAARALSRRTGAGYRHALRYAIARRIGDGRASTPADWRSYGSTATPDLALAGTVVGRTIPEAVSNLTVLLLSLGYLFWVDWRMALVSLLPIFLGFLAFGVIVTDFERTMRTDYDALEESIDAARPVVDLHARVHPAGARARTVTEVRATARELAGAVERFSVYFREKVGELLAGRSLAEIAFSPLTALTIILIGGGLMVRAGSLPPADLVPFLVVGVGLSASLLTLTYLAEEFGVGLKANARLRSFTTVSTDTGATPLDMPSRGLVTIDGDPDRAIERVTAASPADRTAAVLFDPSIITGPIGGFIAGDAARAEHAARIAGVHDRIMSFPRGYDSEGGEDVSLSPWESRRIALARAVAGDAEVVLIDGRVLGHDASVLRAVVDETESRAVVVCVAPPPAFADERAVRLDLEPAAGAEYEEAAR